MYVSAAAINSLGHLRRFILRQYTVRCTTSVLAS